MPKKIRDLIRDLKRAGFVHRGGKGSHRNFTHCQGVKIAISGQLSRDVKRYQERDGVKAIREATE